jgi:hypothetical protein
MSIKMTFSCEQFYVDVESDEMYTVETLASEFLGMIRESAALNLPVTVGTFTDEDED